MSTKITILKDVKLGTWQGMGGAITEATAYNFSKLSPAKQQKIIDAFYGKNGLDFRWCRISIGSNDFCLKPYEYTKKYNLSDFSIAHDKQWVIPMLQQALYKQQNLQIIASPWSPPSFMKIPHTQRYGGILKPWRYSSYAKYIRKWLEAYAEEGISVKYLTPQNEPHAVQIWESCIYSFRAQKRLAYKYLARELKDFDTQILLWDHNKKQLAKVANRLFNGSYVTKYGADKKIAGLCYHWYNGTHPDQMWQVRQKYPDIMMVSSEMCCGWSPYDPNKWANAAIPYYCELMSDINTGASAWVDWNMLLSWQGGPSYCNNFVTSPIILNESNDEFILTPIYVALQKFAKLFPVDSQVVHCDFDSKDVAAVARKTNVGYEAIVANLSNEPKDVDICLGKQKKCVSLGILEIKKVTF